MALSVKVGEFARPAAGTTNTVVTGLGFKPAAVLLFAGGLPSAGAWTAGWEQAVGWIAPVLTNPTEATVELLRSYAANGGAADFKQYLDRGLAGTTAPTVTVATATLDAGGFTIDWTNSPYDTAADLVGYLALGGDTLAATARGALPAMAGGDAVQLSHALDFSPTAALVLAAATGNLAGSVGVIGGSGQWATSLARSLSGTLVARRRLAQDRAIHLISPGGLTAIDAQGILSQAGLKLVAASGAAWTQAAAVTHAAMAGPQQMSLSHPASAAAENWLFVADPGTNTIYRLDASTLAAITPHLTGAAYGRPLQGVIAISRAHPNAPAVNNDMTYNDLIASTYDLTFGPNSNYVKTQTYVASGGVPYDGSRRTNNAPGATTTVWRGITPVEAIGYLYTNAVTQMVMYVRLPGTAGNLVHTAIIGGSGSSNGKFTGINRLVAAGNDLYVSDYAQHRIQQFTLIRGAGDVVTGATFVRAWGGLGAGNGQFNNPHDLAIDPTTGDLWVSDTNNNRLQRFSPSGEWRENLALPSRPVGLTFNAQGVMFVATYDDKTVRRYERTATTSDVAVLYLGNVAADAGIATKPTGAAPATQQIATGMKSKAIILGTTEQTAVDTTGTGWRQSFGADDGTNRRSFHGSAQTGVVNGNADSLYANNQSLLIADNDTPALEAAATVTWTAKKPTVTWTLNNAVAHKYGYLALGDANLFQAYTAGEAVAFGGKLGNNLQFSAAVRAALDATAQGFGNAGNWSGTNTAQAYAALTAAGIGFNRNFGGTVVAAANGTVLGIRFSRPLTGIVEAAALAQASRIGNGVWAGTAKAEAAATGTVLGLGFDINLAARVEAKASAETYFEIQLPAPRTALPEELPGTVNWVLNPSVEVGTLGWEEEGGATLQRVVSEPGSWDGAAGLKVTVPGTAAGEGFHVESITGLELTGLREDGRMRRVVAQVRLRADSAPVAGLQYRVRVIYKDATTTESDPVDLPTLTTSWWRLETNTVEIDPLKVMVRVELVITTSVAAVSTFWADGAQIEEDIGQGASAWVTGSYGADTGLWMGVPHQSMSVRQPLPAIIRGIGRGGAVVVESIMYRSDQDNVYQEELERTVIDAKVTMDSGRTSTWNLAATMTLEGYKRLKPNEDWLSPWLRVTYPDGYVSEGQLGHYLLVPSSQERYEYGGKVKVSAYDALWLMDRQEMGDVLTFPPNTNYSTAIRSILAEMRMPDGRRMTRYTIPDSQYLLGEAVAWQEDTSRLRAANELAEAGALYPLATNAVGWISTKRLGNERLAAQTPVKAWTANLAEGASVDAWIPRIAAVNSELVGAVNISPRALDFVDKIIVAAVNPKGGELRVQADIVTSPDQDARAQLRGFPYANTGGRETLNNPLIANAQAAQQIAFSIADQLTARVEHAKISVLPDPSIDYLRNTAVLGVWDAYRDPVVVGLYLIRRVSFGFTPSTCLQTIDLDYVGAGENQIVLSTP